MKHQTAHTHLFNFQIWLLSQRAFGGGFNTHLTLEIYLVKAQFLWLLRFHSNVFKVPFDIVWLCQFVLLSKPNKVKYIFDFDFPLFCKHCYLFSFHVLLTLPLHNISVCLYKSPQFHLDEDERKLALTLGNNLEF